MGQKIIIEDHLIDLEMITYITEDRLGMEDSILYGFCIHTVGAKPIHIQMKDTETTDANIQAMYKKLLELWNSDNKKFIDITVR